MQWIFIRKHRVFDIVIGGYIGFDIPCSRLLLDSRSAIRHGLLLHGVLPFLNAFASCTYVWTVRPFFAIVFYWTGLGLATTCATDNDIY